MPARIVATVRSGRKELRELDNRSPRKRGRRGVQVIEQFRPDGLIGCPCPRNLWRQTRSLPRLVVISHLLGAFDKSLAHLVVEHEWRVAHIVRQSVHVIVEEGQPVLRARISGAAAHGCIERIVNSIAAERSGVVLPEPPDGFLIEHHFAHRRQVDALERAGRALAVRIESSDRFELAAEKVEAQGGIRAGREKVDQSAAHGELSALAHRRHPQIAVVCGPGDQLVAIHHPADRSRKAHGLDQVARRQLLDQRIDRSQYHRTLGPTGQRRQRVHPRGNGHRIGRNPVIGQAVPGWQREDGVARQNRPQHLCHALHAPPVPRHKDEARRVVWRVFETSLDQSRQHHGLHAVRHIENCAERRFHAGHFVHLPTRA
ncbi:hypothetical protein D3C87_1352170 [compost metagenome]